MCSAAAPVLMLMTSAVLGDLTILQKKRKKEAFKGQFPCVYCLFSLKMS